MNQEEVVAALLRQLGKPSSIFKHTAASNLTFVPPILFQEGFALVNGEDLCACGTNVSEEACENKDHVVQYLNKNEVQCLKKNNFGIHQGSLVCFNSLPVFMNFAGAFKNILIPLTLIGKVSAASNLEGRGLASTPLSGGHAPNFPGRALNSTAASQSDGSNEDWLDSAEKFRKRVEQLPAAVQNTAFFPEWALSSEYQTDVINRALLDPGTTTENYKTISELVENLKKEAKNVKGMRSKTEQALLSKKGSITETAQELGHVEGVISKSLDELEKSRKKIVDIATNKRIAKTAERYGNLLTAILEVTEELLNLENYVKQKSMNFVEDLAKVAKDEAINVKMNREEKIKMQSQLEALDVQVSITQKSTSSTKQTLETVEKANQALKHQLQREIDKNNQLSALMGQIEMHSTDRTLKESDRRSKILDLRTKVRQVGRQLLKEHAKRVELEKELANEGLKNAESIETFQNNLNKCYSIIVALGYFLLGAGTLTVAGGVIYKAAQYMLARSSKKTELGMEVERSGKGKGKGEKGRSGPPPGPPPPVGKGKGKGAKPGASEIPLLAREVNQGAPGHPHKPVGEISPRSDPDTSSVSSTTSNSPGNKFTRAENLVNLLREANKKVAQLQEKIKKGEGDHTTRSQIEIHDAEIAKYKLLIPRIVLDVNVPIWQLLYTRACTYPRNKDDFFQAMSTVLITLCSGDLKDLAVRYQAKRNDFYNNQKIKFAPENSTMEIATFPELQPDVSSKLKRYLHHGLVQGITQIIETFASSSGYSTRLVSEYAASVQGMCTVALVKLYGLFEVKSKEPIVNKLKLAFNQLFLWDDISQTFEENEIKDDEALRIGGDNKLACTNLVKKRMRSIGGSHGNPNTKRFIDTNGRPLMLINLAGAGPAGVDLWNKLIRGTLEQETGVPTPKKTGERKKENEQPFYCILFGKSSQCTDIPEGKIGVSPPYRTVTLQKTTPLMCMMGLLSYIRKCWSESSGDFKTKPSGISVNWCLESKDPRDKTCKNIAKIINQAVRNLAVGSTSILTEEQAKDGATYWNLVLTYIIKVYGAEPQIKDDFMIAKALYSNDNMNLVEARIKQGFTAAKDYNDVFEQIIHKTVGLREEIDPARISESYSAIVDCLFLLQELVDFLQPQCGLATDIKGKRVLRAPSHSPDHNKDDNKRSSIPLAGRTQRARSADRIPRDSFHPSDFRK